MNNYHLLVPTDQRFNNWIVREEVNQRVRLRERYAALQCGNCSKVDEDACLSIGIDPAVVIRSTTDLVRTSDGFIALSVKGVTALTRNAIGGLRFLELPGDPNFMLLVPLHIAETDVARSGVQFHGPEACEPLRLVTRQFPRLAGPDKRCTRCHRYFYTTFLPTLTSMQVPMDPKVIFTTSIASEACNGRETWLWASDAVVAILQASGISGVEYNDPY